MDSAEKISGIILILCCICVPINLYSGHYWVIALNLIAISGLTIGISKN